MTDRDAERRLTVWLHSFICHSVSWNEDCATGRGGHVQLFKADARAILQSDDPVRTLHAQVCVAEIDQYRVSRGGCPERERHIEWLTPKLEAVLADEAQADLFGDKP